MAKLQRANHPFDDVSEHRSERGVIYLIKSDKTWTAYVIKCSDNTLNLGCHTKCVEIGSDTSPRPLPHRSRTFCTGVPASHGATMLCNTAALIGD